MPKIFTLIMENIFVLIGFAIYGILLYYMVAKVIRRYSGKKTRGRNIRSVYGLDKRDTIKDLEKTSEGTAFFTMFNKSSENDKEEPRARNNFSKNIPTANSYTHRKSQQD